MNKYLFILLLSCANMCSAQSTFQLDGTVDMPAGTIILIPAHDSLLYEPSQYYNETQVSKGIFSFTGTLAYPIPMILAIKEGGKIRYRSTKFLLGEGKQIADWRTNNTQSTDAHVSNVAMKEWEAYQSIFAGVNNRLHELTIALNSMEATEANAKIKAQLEREQLQQQRTKDSLILDYTRKHPTSMIPVWDVVKILDKGYTTFLDSFFLAMSSDIRHTHTGRALTSAIAKLKLTVKGSIFPVLSVTDMSGESKKLVWSEGTEKYTLVDFWYSSCYPCMRLFPGYKKLYDAYHSKGFEIIAISIDEGKYIEACRKVIAEKGLNWQQYLDSDKKVVQMLHIQRYPTSFLLDKDGKIIAHDMRPEALEEFLKANLGN